MYNLVISFVIWPPAPVLFSRDTPTYRDVLSLELALTAI